MKRILFLFSILFFLCFSLQKSFAQGNLQFNQVINYTFSLPTSNYGAGMQFSSTYTVPAGKVWKIETMASNSESNTGYSLNGYRVPFYGNNAYAAYKGALWLKEGTQFQLWSNNISGSSEFIVSIIEFNIVP